MIHLRVSPRAETILRSGHPWLFSDSIRDQSQEGVSGDFAVIYDRKDRFLAVGLYDPQSPIRVRVLHVGKPQKLNVDWWTVRFREGIERRKGWLNDQTTGFRWCHGENDGFPGLVVDRYAETLVLKIYTASWFPHLPMIVKIIDECLNPERLILRLSRNIQSAGQSFTPIWSDGMILKGKEFDGKVVFCESGIRFYADVLKGQKTGFFLDQRENRQQVETLAKGRRVLNLFSFSGGFALYALRGGAVSATNVDISRHALDSALANFELNQNHFDLKKGNYHAVQGDVFEWLNFAVKEGRKYDLVIIDPPSLARREMEREEAIRAYGRLAKTSAKLTDSGGVLVASSCSAHVSAEQFWQEVRRSTQSDGFQEKMTTRHPLDHPAKFLEAQYLKTIYLTNA